MKLLPAILLFFLLLPNLAIAGTYTISPSGSSDQNVINSALQSAYNDGGGTVYLNSGVYTINGQVKIGSNTRLKGDPNAIFRVSASSSQFFVDGVGVIGQINDILNNVEITGFQIDGNCENLPPSYANSPPGVHNAERLIDFRASSTNFGSNISIHDMKIYDSYSDGFHVGFYRNVYFYNNICSNNQHDSCYYVDVIGGEIYNNTIFGITDDCARLDNCVKVKVHDNYFTSYNGSNNHGNFKDGANGLQLGDQGFSHGGGSPKPDFTDEIEIYNNVIVNMGLAGIQLDTAGQSQTERVWIHHNTIVNCGYESNAAWGSGICLGPWGSGLIIENNTIDSCYQASILVLSSLGSATAVIRNNNILNTKGNGQASSGGLSSSVVGYGIYNRASGMSLEIVGNYFSGNLKGDSSVLVSNNAPTMISGAGGNGSSIINNLPEAPIVNQKGTTVPETITSIFDILNVKFSEIATDGGNSYTPDIKKETKGKISAGVDIVGFRNMIEEDGKYYIKSLDDVIVVSEADNLASLPVSTDKGISLSKNGDNITADLKVKIRYNTASSYQGKINGIPAIKIKYTEHSETEHFFTSAKTPTIYNISATPNVDVTILNNSYNPQSRFYVPATPWTTKISFEYNNSTSWHFLKVGEVKNTSKNVEYVSLKDSEYWNKSEYIGTIHNIFVIPKALDPYKADQVKVTLYDCYGNVQNLTDYKVTEYNEDLTKFANPFAYLFLGLILILLSGIYTIFKGVIFKRRR